MKKKAILGLILTLVSMAVMTSCKKGEAYPMLTGIWVNTAETHVSNFSGGWSVDEGSITIEFKGHKTNLMGGQFEREWANYWVEDDTHLYVGNKNNPFHFLILELTENRLVLSNDIVDAGIRYVMRRAD